MTRTKQSTETKVIGIRPIGRVRNDMKPEARMAGWMSDLHKFFLTGEPPA